MTAPFVINLTAFDLAQRFVGIKEVAGHASTPQIMAMLQLDGTWPQDDEVPWCSAFVNYICWLLRLPRSKSLAALSWLTVGQEIDLQDAVVGNDVVVLSRDGGGHVGFFAGRDPNGNVMLLGGNQGNSVNVSPFGLGRIKGVRRLV